MANPSQLWFWDTSSPIMVELVEFHDQSRLVALVICSLVLLYLLVFMLMEKLSWTTVDAQDVELIWKILQAIVLILLALPSLQILRMMDELDEPDRTLKGHQWYWT